MLGIKVQITKFVEEHQPNLVECRFTDALGCEKIFVDKSAIFTTQLLDETSTYPTDGVIACEVVERKNGLLRVNTGQPWDIVSMKGENLFEVSEAQVIEFRM